MNDIFDDKYKLLKLENIMYILFIISSIIDIVANDDIKNTYGKNIEPNNDIRKKLLYASYLNLIVFTVFMIRNYKNLKKLTPNEEEYSYAKLRFYGSLLIVIGQIIIIYYFQNTTNFK